MDHGIVKLTHFCHKDKVMAAEKVPEPLIINAGNACMTPLLERKKLKQP